MECLLDFALEERYKRVVELGDKVAEFDTLIKWGSVQTNNWRFVHQYNRTRRKTQS